MVAGAQVADVQAVHGRAVARVVAGRVGSAAVDPAAPAHSCVPRDPSGVARARMTLRSRARVGAGPADSARVGAA